MCSECPFCSLTFRASAFLQSTGSLAVPNRAPILVGHALVVPRRHVERVGDLRNNEFRDLMELGRCAANVLSKSFQASAFDWSIQDGVEAGQTVPHTHLHLIPRRPLDLPSPGDWYPLLQQVSVGVIDSEQRPRLSSAELAVVTNRLRQTAGTIYGDWHLE